LDPTPQFVSPYIYNVGRTAFVRAMIADACISTRSSGAVGSTVVADTVKSTLDPGALSAAVWPHTIGSALFVRASLCAPIAPAVGPARIPGTVDGAVGAFTPRTTIGSATFGCTSIPETGKSTLVGLALVGAFNPDTTVPVPLCAAYGGLGVRHVKILIAYAAGPTRSTGSEF
jgi:hypothetical protein